ncbi:hypothetical protein [Rubrivirga marina]|uniref:Uncharacterized protein n=1 Tax=Rubrivirga marina TaxID=1196024 RepID=A0A271ISV5_9BACT|nr:hypothetical protein [Rubrivirga marina]PAP74217.1 hypothetical protein BSZ37_21385 [Rubrivirga marina]
MTRTPHLDRLLPDAPERVVFDLSPEREAAQCRLAALLIGLGRALDVTRHRYAFSVGLATPASAPPGTTAYAHYFRAPDGALVPVTTRHTPGLDDLGGLVRLDP